MRERGESRQLTTGISRRLPPNRNSAGWLSRLPSRSTTSPPFDARVQRAIRDAPSAITPRFPQFTGAPMMQTFTKQRLLRLLDWLGWLASVYWRVRPKPRLG